MNKSNTTLVGVFLELLKQSKNRSHQIRIKLALREKLKLNHTGYKQMLDNLTETPRAADYTQKAFEDALKGFLEFLENNQNIMVGWDGYFLSLKYYVDKENILEMLREELLQPVLAEELHPVVHRVWKLIPNKAKEAWEAGDFIEAGKLSNDWLDPVYDDDSLYDYNCEEDSDDEDDEETLHVWLFRTHQPPKIYEVSKHLT